MDVSQPLALLGGLSPQQFMRRYWQKKPLLIRQAIPNFRSPINRASLFDLAGGEAVESRLVAHSGAPQPGGWTFKRGPFTRRALPAVRKPGWTLLVQGVDLHDNAAHALLQQFRFVPDARLDDLMISFATDGGGVGPHFDSYDVFLLQAEGQRRWRIGRQKDLSLQDGAPLKLLANFEPEQEWVLDPGDMLYLPPRYAHDGVAVGECITCSIGFRAPSRGELARELLQRLAEGADEGAHAHALYRDATQPAVDAPGAIPAALQAEAASAVQAALNDPQALARALGEHLTEPKPGVWFEAGRALDAQAAFRTGIRLDRRTRMQHDARHVFINGESYRAAGRDATLMRRLADQRQLDATALAQCSGEAHELISSWCEAGWVHAV